MNRYGHLIGAGVILVITKSILDEFTAIHLTYSFIVLHLPFLFVGALIPDRAEPPAYGDVWHRGFFHSKLFLLLLFILIPLTYGLYQDSPKELLFDIPISWVSSSLFFIYGIATHIILDSFTKKLSWL